MAAISENARCVTINTGNILSLNDITKKPGQTPSEEVGNFCNVRQKNNDIRFFCLHFMGKKSMSLEKLRYWFFS